MKTMIRTSLALCGLLLAQPASADVSNPQIGNLLFEDNFNSLNSNNWTPNEGDGCAIGLCGWGNQELQWYSSNNLSIEDVPGEPGNKALVFQARNDNIGGRAFSSGKIDSQHKLAVQYGMIEVRMRVPDLATGRRRGQTPAMPVPISTAMSVPTPFFMLTPPVCRKTQPAPQ